MRTRTHYEPEFRKEIAEGYHTWKLSPKDIEAKGIKMNNVHRWMKEFFGPGGRGPKPSQPSTAPSSIQAASPAQIAPATDDRHTLSLRKIKRGANGRYREKDKSTIMSALLQMPVPEVSEKTGVNAATLYLWKDQAQKQTDPPTSSGALIVVPEKHNNRPRPATQAVTPNRAELLMNPVTTEAILAGIRKSEGFVNIEKYYKNRVAAYRAGVIDFDEDDHRFCMGYLQITGGLPRGARR